MGDRTPGHWATAPILAPPRIWRLAVAVRARASSHAPLTDPRDVAAALGYRTAPHAPDAPDVGVPPDVIVYPWSHDPMARSAALWLAIARRELRRTSGAHAPHDAGDLAVALASLFARGGG